MDLHLDKETYGLIWETLIAPQIDEYKEKFGSCVLVNNDSRDLIWEEYETLNLYCKSEYMTDPKGLLDRHKVSACYLIAIARVKPIHFITPPLDDRYFVVNEKIAISTALSIVRAYVLASCDDLADSEADVIRSIFDGGLRCPDERYVHHGSYLDNFVSEIYYTGKERKLHVLPIAHELFLLEVITHMSGCKNEYHSKA